MKGGYTSLLIGAGLNLRPRVIAPTFELNATAQLRQRIAAAAARRPGIERSAERFVLTATWFISRNDARSDTKKPRAGISVTWTEGSDPFENQPPASTIVIGFRLGVL